MKKKTSGKKGGWIICKDCGARKHIIGLGLVSKVRPCYSCGAINWRLEK